MFRLFKPSSAKLLFTRYHVEVLNLLGINHCISQTRSGVRFLFGFFRLIYISQRSPVLQSGFASTHAQ